MSTPTKTEHYDLGWADCRKREVEPLREENTRLREALRQADLILLQQKSYKGAEITAMDIIENALTAAALAAGKGTSPDLSADPAAYDRIADRELGLAAGKGEMK